MIRTSSYFAILVASVAHLMATPAAFADDGRELKVEQQPLSESLKSVADEFGLDIAFFSETTAGLDGIALAGNYTSQQAFDALLGETDLEYTQLDNGTIVIRAKEGEGLSDLGNSRTKPILMAQNQTPAEENQTGSETSEDDEEDRVRLENITVTGTHIRGIAPDSSPVRIYTSEDIEISGAATAQDFIKTLTANFGGGANANIPPGLPFDTTGGGNSVDAGSFGSSVNLRGLGSSATLVVLNGRRLAPASFNGNFVDISMIPASAIERVETLTDGASSIYGSDAVAGVVNFVLRDDFDGVETSLRYGTGTNGSPDQYRASVTGGKNWDTGHALLVYEFFDQDQLSVEDRRFAQKDFLPNFLLPSQERHSVLASAAQDVTPSLGLFADFTYSNRKARNLRTQFRDDLTIQNDASSENLNISGGGAWNISSDWFFDFSGTYSKVDTRNETSIASDRIRTTDSNMWAADAKVSGSLFHLPGGDIKLAVGGHYREESLFGTEVVSDTVDREAKRDVYAVFAEAFIPIIGPENNVSGIERLELNVSGRYEDYSDFGTTSNPKVGLLWSPVDGLNFRGSYSTSFRAPELGQVGQENGALIYRTSFVNNLFGLTAADPSIADVVVLQVSGIPPDGLEPETSNAFTAGFDFNRQWGTHSLTSSVTWFDIDFEDRLGRVPRPGNVIIFDTVNIAFNDPGVFPEGTIIFVPTADELRKAIESRDFINTSPGADDPFDAGIISFVGVIRNLSRSVVRGFDLALSYTYELDHGSVLLGLDGTFLQDVKQQAATTTPVVETVDTLFNPVDLKLRGRVGYSNDNFAANIFINHVDDYRVDSTTDSELMDSWTTVDLSLSYDTKERFDNSVFNNTVFRLSVINVFDEDPPQAPVFEQLRVDGFDPTNASPLGRFIAFEITKRW